MPPCSVFLVSLGRAALFWGGFMKKKKEEVVPTRQMLLSREAEESVIGSILQKASQVMPALMQSGLSETWFSTDIYAEIFHCCLSLYRANSIIDMVTVQELLVARGTSLEDATRVMYDAIEATPTSSHALHYIEIVKDLYLKRQQKMVLEEHQKMLHTESKSEDVIASLRSSLDMIEIPEEELDGDAIKKKILESHKHAKKSGFISIPSRFPSVNRKLHGYKKGKVCLVAARPSKGKTTFALNEAEGMASSGRKVGIISLETETEEIYETLAGVRSGLDLFKLRDDELSAEDVAKFEKALDEVLAMNISVSDKSMDIDHIVNWMNYMCYHKQLDAVFIDYVQIISEGSLGRSSMNEKVTAWSSKIFEATRRNNVATILLSQISRSGEAPFGTKPEDRWKFTPRLHNLKDSGRLEEDAYQALVLYDHPTETIDGSPVVPFIIDIQKHKRGPIGKIHMTYKKNQQTFVEKYN
jgi:replicative DNA helicase